MRNYAENTITENSVQINKSVDKRFLMFTFPEHLREQAAAEAIEEWDEQFLHANDTVSLIWNCRDMRNYESKARVMWQDALSRHKKKIRVIWLISDSAIISTAARILAAFTNLTIRPVKSVDRIQGYMA